MSAILEQEFLKTLQQRMTNKDFLKKTGIRKKQIMTILREGNWSRIFEEVFEKSPSVSCEKTAELCADITKKIGGISGQELLRYVYDWTRAVMFPENFQVHKTPECEKARKFYCELLHILLEMEKEHKEFVPTRQFGLLPYEISEGEDADTGREYQIFLDLMEEQYMLEFYRISAEITPFDSLGHVAGVHYVAMHVAKQLKELGKPVDLKLMSGAAALHDIGKFGCREKELRRTPYLHYYYSDVYTQRFKMPEIGHIAVNHSTWDLELDELSIENLILIYADFRVKSTRDANGKEVVHFYFLKESFDVILNKLDNVDQAKENRYRLVYAKLKDFENYMENFGVNTDLTCEKPTAVSHPDFVLMSQNQSVREIKYTAIEHNIYVMTRMNSITALRNILEAARSEKNWRNTRAYVNIFEEYFTYMNEKQINMTLQYLFELLLHSEVDIRRQASYLCGKIIAKYEKEYRKELPQDVELENNSVSAFQVFNRLIKAILYPDYTVTEQHREWLGRCLKRIIVAVQTECRSEKEGKQFLEVFLRFFEKHDYERKTAFILLEAAEYVRFSMLDEIEIRTLLGFAEFYAECENIEEGIRVLQFLRKAAASGIPKYLIQPEAVRILEKVKGKNAGLQFVAYKLRLEIGLAVSNREETEHMLFDNESLFSQIFLENMKVATSRMIKKANIELLGDVLKMGDPVRISRIAVHLTNLFSASRTLVVRECCGDQLVQMMPFLSSDQRNEIVLEMAESLGSGEFQYVRYVPLYLGKMAMYLYPEELDELIGDTLTKYINSSDMTAVMYTLHTIGVMVEHYPEYVKYGEPEEVYINRRKGLLGLLMKGLSHYQEVVSVDALTVIGRDIFGSDILTVEEKREIFAEIQKQMLSAIAEQSQKEIAFFGRASSLRKIYSFITEYEFANGEFDIKDNPKIAFFPGTFDPFSIGHKEIVREVKKLGFEVYLSVDEFSWSKKTQPKLLRKKIIQMSVADMGDVYLFPCDIPINIANPRDMKLLKRLFPGKEVYLVAGADVIEGASAYRQEAEEGSVHYFKHILFSRKTLRSGWTGVVQDKVFGDCLYLKLSHEYDEVSSSKIRENIDRNRDISNLVDPLAQRFIAERSLYLREPKYKKTVSRQNILMQTTLNLSEDMKKQFQWTIDKENVLRCGLAKNAKVGDRGIWMEGEDGSISCGAFYREVPLGKIYEEFRNEETVAKIRRLASGKLVVLYALFAKKNEKSEKNLELMLNELIASCLKEGFTHMVIHFGDRSKKMNAMVEEILFRHGFVKIQNQAEDLDVYFVDMSFPMVAVQDTESIIKDPFNTNKNVRQVLVKTQKQFLMALTRLYPGSLVISFDSEYMSYQMLEMVVSENNVSARKIDGETLGSKMCIPYGKLMRELIVPNTVTKAIYTERIFNADASEFGIAEYPNYPSLKTQIKTIESFSRPVILVDDILHNGEWLRKLYPMIQEGNVKVDKLIVGVLSGRGTDMAAIHDIPVDSVYFIPNMREWFSEVTMYPFLGGNYIETDGKPQAGRIPSLNQIMPYTFPPFSFMEDVTWDAYYEFSNACLGNTLEILCVLEEEYQKMYQKNLTLGRLNEVIRETYYIDQGENLTYDMQVPASSYVRNDILKMKRLRKMQD